MIDALVTMIDALATLVIVYFLLGNLALLMVIPKDIREYAKRHPDEKPFVTFTGYVRMLWRWPRFLLAYMIAHPAGLSISDYALHISTVEPPAWSADLPRMDPLYFNTGTWEWETTIEEGSLALTGIYADGYIATTHVVRQIKTKPPLFGVWRTSITRPAEGEPAATSGSDVLLAQAAAEDVNWIALNHPVNTERREQLETRGIR